MRRGRRRRVRVAVIPNRAATSAAGPERSVRQPAASRRGVRMRSRPAADTLTSVRRGPSSASHVR